MINKTKRSGRWILAIKKRKYLGVHLIAEFWYGRIIENSKEIEKILIGAVQAAKSQPLKITIHKFSPHGLTGVVLLSESHLAIHSWPEYNYLAVDIFTCGNKAMPYKTLEFLKKKFKPKKVEVKEIKRGKRI